mgnify:CR=1 FL=1|tara:strand:- start:416 stop:586 length:171 start_codon:yes stop_codon:yes gene_type:complete
MTYTYKKIIDFFTKKESTNTILRKEDNAFIPINEENKDYQDYLEWVAKGNTIEEAD